MYLYDSLKRFLPDSRMMHCAPRTPGGTSSPHEQSSNHWRRKAVSHVQEHCFHNVVRSLKVQEENTAPRVVQTTHRPESAEERETGRRQIPEQFPRLFSYLSAQGGHGTSKKNTTLSEGLGILYTQRRNLSPRQEKGEETTSRMGPHTNITNWMWLSRKPKLAGRERRTNTAWRCCKRDDSCTITEKDD